MYCIAYRDKPEDSLFTFSKVGDSVSIGRDKRFCKICLGANAAGVSRIHLKIELKLVCGSEVLVANDRSTFGTGYNGSSYTKVNERQLKVNDVIEIGGFFFVILENCDLDKTDPIVPAISSDAHTVEKGSASANLLEQTRPVKRKSGAVTSDFETKRSNLRSVEDPVKKRSSEMKSSFSSLLIGNKNIHRSDLDDNDFVADSFEISNSSKNERDQKQRHRQALAAFLPSSDEDDEESFSYKFLKRQKEVALMFAKDTPLEDFRSQCITRSKENSSGIDGTIVSDSCSTTTGKSSRIHQTRLTDLFKSSKHEASRSHNRTICTVEEMVIGSSTYESSLAELDSNRTLQPLMNSTQIGHETSPVREHRHLSSILEDMVPSTSDSQQKNYLFVPKMPTTSLRRSPRKRRNLSEESSLIRKFSDKAMDEEETIEDTMKQSTKREVTSKRKKKGALAVDQLTVKSEPIEAEADAPNIINKSLFDYDNQTIAKMKQDFELKREPSSEEQVEEEENLVLGMDLETLRRKLAKTVELEDLERKSIPKPYFSNDQSEISCLTNFKRFKKAAQGCHNAALAPEFVKTQIIGFGDLMDYSREFSRTS